LVLGEEHVACGDAIEIIADSEVKPEGPLHVESLEAGDRQAKGGGDPVGDVLERTEIVERRPTILLARNRAVDSRYATSISSMS
jgi:hypothetical protein